MPSRRCDTKQEVMRRIPQDIMASAMGIQSKEVLQIANRLRADKLIDMCVAAVLAEPLCVF